MSKRLRTNSGFVVTKGPKRPIDKGLIVVNQSASSSQSSTDLADATFPCTIMGIRWSLAIQGNTTTSALVSWAIVRVREGRTADTMSQVDGAHFYDPEQDVLAFGVCRTADLDAGTGPAVRHFEGATKAMRKLMVGDKIQFISIADANSNPVDGVIQLFCKS